MSEPTLEDYKEAMRVFSVYTGRESQDPRGFLRALDSFVEATERRFRPALDLYACLQAWIPTGREKLAQEIVSEMASEEVASLPQEELDALKERVKERLRNLGGKARTPQRTLRQDLHASLLNLAKCSRFLEEGLSLTDLLPKLMDASATVGRLAAGVLSRVDDEWSKEWPEEPGNYWFHGTSFFARQDGQEPKFHFVNVRSRGEGRPPIHIIGGTFMYRSDCWEGLWQRIPDPTPPQ